MCKISKTIKFCSCNKVDASIKNVWTYYRLVEGKKEFLVGEVLWMQQLKPEITQNHKRTICRMLNKSNCFDFDVTPKEGDILQIIFNAHEVFMVFHYFLYTNNKWKTVYINSREVGYERDILAFGEITNGLTSHFKESDFVKLI